MKKCEEILDGFVKDVKSGKYDEVGRRDLVPKAVEHYGTHVMDAYYINQDRLSLITIFCPTDKMINNPIVETLNVGDNFLIDIKRKGKGFDEYVYVIKENEGEVGKCSYEINFPIVDLLKIGYLLFDVGYIDFVVPKSKQPRRSCGTVVVKIEFKIDKNKDFEMNDEDDFFFEFEEAGKKRLKNGSKPIGIFLNDASKIMRRSTDV